MIDPASCTAALIPTISAALLAEFAPEVGESPAAFALKLTRLATAIATGVSAGLVPYIIASSVVVNPAGIPIGKVT